MRSLLTFFPLVVGGPEDDAAENRGEPYGGADDIAGNQHETLDTNLRGDESLATVTPRHDSAVV